MPRRLAPHTAAPALVALLLAVAVGCGADEPYPGQPSDRAVADVEAGVDDAVPPEVAAATADWPLPGRDHAASRAVPDSAITAATVDRLEEVWRAPLEGGGVIGNAATTPLVLGDRIVVQDLDSTVRVLDLASGELVWETKVEGGTTIGPNGPAVGWGRVYAAKGMRSIMALDLETGDELWTTELAETETTGIDIQPQVVDGLVLVSTVPVSLAAQYTGGDRGVLHALDAETGEVVWSFDTVDSEDLWGAPDVNSGGGAWYTPAVDVEAGIVYWGIANPAPFAGTPEHPNGSSRPGPNLYTNSVVALDVATGEMLWHHQVFPHDLFDRDHVHTLLAEVDGETAVISAGKGGVVLRHDPETGDELWRTEVGIHRNDDLTELDGPTDVWPGTYGGILTPPSTADGVVYVATLNAPTEMHPDTTSSIGSELGTAPGEVVAVDASDGRVLWATEVDGDPLGGATVVGDLVLTATYQGQIYALARDDGRIVRRIEAPGGINGWPAVAGERILWPVGMSSPPSLVAYGLADD